MGRSLGVVVLLAVLGASCSGDRPAPRTAASPSPSVQLDLSGEEPACPRPGPPPDGFVLRQTRNAFEDGPAVREVYQHEDGRLVVFLLGVSGELGEGAPVEEPIQLTGDRDGTLFGTPEHDTWTLSWRGGPPCEQMAIIGNGFSRDDFLAAMAEVGLLEA